MLTSDDVQQVVGADAYGSDGSKIGKIGQVFLDDQTGAPVFATVHTGLLGTSENYVPLDQAIFVAGRLELGFDSKQVKGAPNVSPDDGHLSPDEEQALYDYYGLSYVGEEPTAYSGQHVVDETTASSVTEAPSDDAMTRSEERLHVGKRREVSGRVRLRKYVVTENVQITVPVRREKAVLESIPAGEDGDVDSGDIIEGAALSGEQPEIILREEVPVVETVVQPVERVRLGTEEYVDEELVTGEVRKEQIEVTGDVTDATEDLQP